MSLKIYSIFLATFFSVSLQAQDPYLQIGDEEAEKRSVALTKQYQPEIVMRSEQAARFSNKLEEFLIREHNILNQDLSAKDKIYLIRQLREQLVAEMGTILTRRQLRRFAQIHEQIQPILVEVTPEDKG